MMKRNQKNRFYIFFVFFFLFSTACYSKSFIKKNTYKIQKNEKIKVSETTFLRIKDYLDDKINSKNLNNKFYQISGIYMSISQDGANSSISFCNAEKFELCAEQMLSYQTLKKCERISKQKCFLIFRGKVFLPSRENKIILKEKFSINKNSLGGIHSDIYAKTKEELFVSDE